MQTTRPNGEARRRLTCLRFGIITLSLAQCRSDRQATVPVAIVVPTACAEPLAVDPRVPVPESSGGAPAPSDGSAVSSMVDRTTVMAGPNDAGPFSSVRVRGLVTVGFEEQTFAPCGSNQSFWLGNLNAAQILAGVRGGQWRIGYVGGDAVVSGPGRYGHLGHWTREINFARVHTTEGACP